LSVAVPPRRAARLRLDRSAPWLILFLAVSLLASPVFLLLGWKAREAAPPPSAPAPAANPLALAQTAALDALSAQLARLGGVAGFRDVLVYRAGPEGERGVCGQLRAQDAPGYRDFVVLVRLGPAGRASVADMVISEDISGGPALFRARQRHCHGPAEIATRLRGWERNPAPSAAPLVTPPAPSAEATKPAAVPAVAAVPAPMSESLVARAPANLRSAPGGTVLRVLPRGQVMRVFGTAPGGWFQVGGTEAWGWVHASLVEHVPTPSGEAGLAAQPTIRQAAMAASAAPPTAPGRD
jgi:hypothetical protein